jgi:hypothetical protein
MINSEQVIDEDLLQLLADRAKRLIGQDVAISDGLDEIAGLLARYDPAPSPILNAIDQKGQDFATYFFATYSDTRDVDRSILAYKGVKSLVRYILLIDRQYEVGNKKYERIARGLLQTIKKSHDGHLRYSIDFALKQFWPFWEFEQMIKKRMVKGYTFTVSELRHFNLFKSSDAPLIYARVLDSELCNFNPNIATVMHYNQALLDIQDDFEDIEEDVHDMMPNIFILAAAEHTPYSKILKNKDQARNIISSNGTLDSILSIIEQYNNLVQGISVPQNFAFLKQLTKDYTNKLLITLNVISK